MTQRPSYATIAHHESFKHENLKLSENSIRLFQVQQGTKDEHISLRITQYSIGKRPPYKAISYTWGTSQDSESILVNGRAFSIHLNLFNLLKQLRLKKETAFLWADRLCIDQENLRERNFHVQLMGKIYEQASSVIVWLGLPALDRTEIRAMDFVKEIAMYRKTHGDIMFQKSYLVADVRKRWETLLKMCQHHYWTRTWIIQEFLRAKSVEVVCGAASLDWDQFDSLLDYLSTSDYSQPSIIRRLLESRPVRLSFRRKAGEGSPLRELLHEYHDSSCTERRDKVYGILGLACESGEDENGDFQGVKPDYKKHIVQVYLDALMCIDGSLTTKEDIASSANLVRRTLLLTQEDMADYVRSHVPSSIPSVPLFVKPLYVGVIKDMIPGWTSISDLKLKLAQFQWGDFVGYEMKSPRPALGRRSSSRVTHSALPEDLINNVVRAAELDTGIPYLHNYPQYKDLMVAPEHLVQHSDDKRHFDNKHLQKPTVIVEQLTGGDTIRLGFACTNTRKGDLLLQFQGLDYALIVRRQGLDITLIGKAAVLKHIALGEQSIDAICDKSPWFSGCPIQSDSEPLVLETDALSLAELLTRD